MSRRLAWLLGPFALLAALGWWVYGGGRLQTRGAPAPAKTSATATATRAADEPMILFGDLHVHTTFSADAFMRNLPFVGGEGAHPPADACDFARFCAQLDFFALTDHAESLSPHHWRETRQAVRDCQAVAAGPSGPDVVPFTGFEWTQVGRTAEAHYGHRNVIFAQTDDAHLPARPIAARGLAANAFQRRPPGLSLWTLARVPIDEFDDRQDYLDLARLNAHLAGLTPCPTDVPSPKLPADCREVAETPGELFAKLDAWGLESMVIPHGTTWGFYTPPGYTYDKSLKPENRSDRERLIEVFSGHGNSEEYRAWRAAVPDAEGKWTCPPARDGYEPCCVRAGRIMAARCAAEGLDAATCRARAAAAEQAYVEAGAAGHLTVPGATVVDWGACEVCTDCFLPAFRYRPGGAAQYVLAKGDFAPGRPPRHARLGFIASSDNHSARPGTGYKEYGRRLMTEAAGPTTEALRARIFGMGEAPTSEPRAIDEASRGRFPGWRLVDAERQGSFFLTGGLVAVHAARKDRASIWAALEAKRVYGTSGPRIGLWFDHLAADGARHPMGATVTSTGALRFSVRAQGAFVQTPGCPGWVGERIGAARQARLCADECYHPSSERHPIVRIEVVRIRLQQRPEEPIEELVEDPWRVLPCPTDGDCKLTFEDPDPPGSETAYYVRAIQAATPVVNADPVRCRGEDCDPCYSDFRTPFDEDCLADAEERAWSSPIWVRSEAPR